jgi:hypothetical protein
VLFQRGADSQELAYFSERTAKALRRGYTSEPSHGIVPWFDATMILFQSLVEIRVTSVEHVIPKDFAHRARVGIMPIGRDPRRGVTNHLDGLRRSKRLAASRSRFSLRLASTRLPSRSLAR